MFACCSLTFCKILVLEQGSALSNKAKKVRTVACLRFFHSDCKKEMCFSFVGSCRTNLGTPSRTIVIVSCPLNRNSASSALGDV